MIILVSCKRGNLTFRSVFNVFRLGRISNCSANRRICAGIVSNCLIGVEFAPGPLQILRKEGRQLTYAVDSSLIVLQLFPDLAVTVNEILC